MLINKRGFAVVFALLLWLSIVVSSVSAVDLPQGTLNASQISTLFSAKTVAADSVDGQGQELVSYFSPDGQYQEARKGWLESGTWWVRKDGRLCMEIEGKKQDCRIIVPQGSAYLRYAVKLDGNHKHELTYSRFQSGQRLTQMSDDPILPLGTLKKREIVELFSGKTVESITARKGRVSQTYYHADGKLEQLRGGKKRYGTWRVTKNSRICLMIENSQEKCRIIVKEGNQFKKYVVKKNSDHQHSVTYRQFFDGKVFK